MPEAQGGIAESLHQHAVDAIADVAKQSLAAAFIAWSQRSFIEYLLFTPNTSLAQRLLPQLLAGNLAGATALSNAMKFLCGMEPLQVTAREDGEFWVLDGVLPWVTNLADTRYVVALPVRPPKGAWLFWRYSTTSRGWTDSPTLRWKVCAPPARLASS